MGKGGESVRRRLSMRGYLVLLVLSVLIPVLLFTGVLFARYYVLELARIEEGLKNDARKLAFAIDNDLAGLQYTLQTLATSDRLVTRDLEGFYQEAARVREFLGVHVLLRDLNGQQLLNTRLPWGEALPRDPLAGDQRVIETKSPVVTGVVHSPVTQQPEFSITVPVVERNQVVYFLNLSVPPGRLADLLGQTLEEGRAAGVFDRTSAVLAVAPGRGDIVGQPAPVSFTQQAKGEDGVWRGAGLDGAMVRGAYARSSFSGWWIWVSVPERAVQSALTYPLLAFAALGAGLTLLAIVIAYGVGGQLSGSIQTLAAEAAALGRGELQSAQRLPVRELDQVGEALVSAALALRERERERDRAEQDLRRLSETLEKMVSERTRELVSEMRKRAETEETLRQVQKMEAIGQLTGGIAHDFNNMLGVVLGNLELAQRRLAKGEYAIDNLLANALEGGRRAASLTARLLAFARQQPLAPEPLDANDLVSGMSELLNRSLGETVRLETALASGLWRIHADPSQLENAILNLSVNARDAMPEGGKLIIETANAVLDEDYAAEHADVAPGDYVMIAVCDTGTGMPPQVAEKAFDPFFTTKGSGAGTGLGLSQVYGFVKQSGGHVRIDTAPGQGTTMRIYLPRYFGALETATETEDRPPVPVGNDSITVLVVEDEAGVRRYSTDALRELGYQVLEAANAADALETIDAKADISLLFTDVVMPDMNGRRLAEVAAQRRPALKVLFTTGYTRDAIVHDGMLDPSVNVLAKPFTMDQLARKIAEVLGEEKRPG
jgi:signal transduction histidine kinase/CheY-like chemotaxis protein